MENPQRSIGGRPVRSDAIQNRRRILDATIELVLEVGGEPTRDAIAKRAGVGIATLYRHFPSQQSVLRVVAIDVLDRTIAAGNEALADAKNGVDALRSYLHTSIDNGLGVVNIVFPLLDDTEWPQQRAAATDLLGRILEAIHIDGSDVGVITNEDISFASIRFCRPLAIGLDPGVEREIAHRQLDVYVDGLIGR